MFGAIGQASGATPASGILSGQTSPRDDESRLAHTLRQTTGGADGKPATRSRETATARSVAAEIVRAIESRLPGRIRELIVDVDRNDFVLRGVSCSYYVKQLAGHLAMSTLEARMLGRLSNEIEVRPAR